MKHLELTIYLITFLLAACGGHQQQTMITDTDRMLEENPQRALAVLDSLENLGSLSDKEQMHLVWNRAMAHQALGMSLAEDEQLPEAIAHYRMDADKQADSYLLEASYLKWTGREVEAVSAIDRGLAAITDPTKRVQLLTAKADILEHLRQYGKAAVVLKEALGHASPKHERALLDYKILNFSI